MTVVLNLKPEVEEALRKRSQLTGTPMDALAGSLLEREITRMRDLDEILAPVRKNFAESGMTEEDLDALIESERQSMWEEKHGKSGVD